MKYYLVRAQKGQGCDYTIRCGLDIKQIFAKTKAEAIKKISGIPDDWKEVFSKDWRDCMDETEYLDNIDPGSDQECSQMTLLEVNEEIDMIPILKAKLAEVNAHCRLIQDQKNQAAKEEKDLAEYKRLQKKFGKKITP